MRILILGGSGMLGHKAWQVLKDSLDVYITVRGSFSEFERFGIFDKNKTICGIDVLNFDVLEKKIEKLRPEVILNCIGIVKQVNEARDAIKCIEVNSLFPHRLASLSGRINSRLIHISTDCVFSGKKGNYNEADIPDPIDLYDRTKLLGEIDEGNALTIRTSLIGKELSTKHSLLEWFLSQQGSVVKGYSKAIFSGFPTVTFSKILKSVILKHKNLKGIYHISSAPISKLDLLTLIRNKMNLDLKIVPEDKFCCDRSLDSSRFIAESHYNPPAWDTMIDELVKELKDLKY